MRKPWGRGSAGRAMRSQRIGQGFESPRLHHHKQTASRKRCRLFMAAKPSRERTCARHITYACRFALFSCTQACDLSVRAGSAACRARRFRPPPPPVACRSLPHKRTASSLPCPYGEAPLVSTTRNLKRPTLSASRFRFFLLPFARPNTFGTQPNHSFIKVPIMVPNRFGNPISD